MKFDRKILLPILTIFLLGLMLRIFPIKVGYHFWDETVYLQQAEQLIGLSPHIYSEMDFRPPLFTVLLAGIMFLTHSLNYIHITVSILTSLGILTTFIAGKTLYSYRTGLIAAAIFALSPIAIDMSHHVLLDGLLPILWGLVLIFLLKARDSDKPLNYVLTGIFAGLAVLTKFTSLVLVPFIVIGFFLQKEGGKFEKLKHTLIDKQSWCAASGFLLALIPYLGWNAVNFGNPVHAFIKASQLTGSPEPFMTYITGIHMLAPLPIIFAGIFAFRKFDKNTILLISGVLLLFMPLQFMIPNREVRYLAPIVPFISIILGKALSDLDIYQPKVLNAAILFVLFSASAFVMFSSSSMAGTNTYRDVGTAPVQEAAEWLRTNTPKNTTVYSNTDYPPLAYYSDRKLILISISLPVNESVVARHNESGYLYYDSESFYTNPTKEDLESSPYFAFVKTFRGTVSLYRYDAGSNSQTS